MIRISQLYLYFFFLIGSSRFDVTTAYGRLTLAEIYNEMDSLASSYPEFVTVTTTQDEFGLPSSCRSFESQHVGCITKYLVIEDPLVYSNSIAGKALKRRPDVFLSGALHGDERVGPVAILEVAKLLALAASCESGQATGSNECNNFYSNFTARQAGWLARLVATRRIVILPAANAKGYHLNNRYEKYVYDNGSTLSIDPNRDFSFDNSPSNCMRSIAARSINELFHEYLFQMSMTYHGGIESISFEWGALSIPLNKVSPDDIGQRILAEKMSLFAGELSPSTYYTTGDMNDVVYGVYGGFEDWVYAGSWKTDMTVQCSPNTYGGYDASKTSYDDATLNTFNILVETSNSKNPASSAYGSDTSLLDAPFLYDANVDNGYATKHVRTALMAIDAVEPYVEINRCKGKRYNQEYKPLRALTNRWSKRYKKIRSKFGSKPKVWWSVGGSFTVDETFIIYGKWSDLPSTFNGLNQPSHTDVISLMSNSNFYTTKTKSGSTRWSDPTSATVPSFAARIKTSKFASGDLIAVFAIAKVDQNWSLQPNNIWPNVSVQSHMVKIRTDSNYNKNKNDREVQGQLYWVSVPLSMKIK